MSSPPFDRSLGSKYTGTPNPAWSWCQKIDSTPGGRKWMEGEKQGWETIATAEEDPKKLYALMISGIVPRPIALVSTISEEGIENLAPFSWFGMISNWPPVVAVSCLNHGAAPGRLKDTSNNVKNSKGGFVISIISEPFVELANASSIDAPPEVSEWSLSGLTKVPSIHVKASRVKESAFSMECELYQTTPIVDPSSGETTTTLILAHVKYIHVRKDMLNQRGTIDITKFKPISRLGDNSYGRVGDAFKLARPSWAADEGKIQEAIKRVSED
ncbi:hypothetical protein L210DRAFT_3648313 [Boletus edulis BED1]|uniref:Flavin reductase like domain-containing protein n=1 Tax=Boletus edulis BED1 TaxID=1328754 RepID=A0AAD4GBP4_BOLED|nr:hypothetical protein L210DRAFT_3648313 [Boletus edulis BED1]